MDKKNCFAKTGENTTLIPFHSKQTSWASYQLPSNISRFKKTHLKALEFVGNQLFSNALYKLHQTKVKNLSASYQFPQLFQSDDRGETDLKVNRAINTVINFTLLAFQSYRYQHRNRSMKEHGEWDHYPLLMVVVRFESTRGGE